MLYLCKKNHQSRVFVCFTAIFWPGRLYRANLPVLSNVQRRCWNSSFSLAKAENVSALLTARGSNFSHVSQPTTEGFGRMLPQPTIVFSLLLRAIFIYTYTQQLNGIETLHPQIVL